MLDGLLGRNGFSSKCKPLIKLTRRRIDVVQRKRVATQKFLKKDIADLLANGLEHNAFGRAEGLISELVLSSCYDFIDHVCEIILKHLSAMQKLSDCPEECKEAVASLMFAAARFSDLPELRELRDIFQERYGRCMECNVNEKLVQHITPKPPSTEQKLQLLQDVASEFSMTWNSSAFEPGMMTSIPDAREIHDQPKAQAPLHGARSKYGTPLVEEPDPKKDNAARLVKKTVAVDPQIKSREAVCNGKLHGSTGNTDPIFIQDQLKHKPIKGQELRFNGHTSQPGSKTIYKVEENYDASERRGVYMVDPIPANVKPLLRERRLGDRIEDHTQNAVQRAQEINTLSPRRVTMLPPKVEKLANSSSYEKCDRTSSNVVISARKLPGEETDGWLKSNFKSSIPPPYVKPQRSSSKDRSKLPEFLGNGEDSGFISDDRFKRVEQVNVLQNKDGHHEYMTEEYYKGDDDSPGVPTPKRRPRRRHVKSSSGSDNGGEVRVIRRTATSRRRTEATVNGLQIVFHDDHDKRNSEKDDEEQMLDKLLLKHCKKDLSVAAAASELESPRSKSRNESVRKHTARSFSLPREQMAASSSETKKVFNRAVSFNQDPCTSAKHVHPKLPDYDDLAARFAAMRRDDE